MSFILDGRVLPLDTPFEHDGINYPANWLRLTTPEERAAIGITERPDYPRPDDRFYWVSENPDGTWTAIPKDIDAIRSMLVTQVKTTAYSLLAPTDYKYTRKVETGRDIDDATVQKRADIRAANDTNLKKIKDAKDVDEMAALVFEWPQGL